MKNIKIISATRENEKKFKNSFLYKSIFHLKKIYPNLEYEITFNNKQGLPKIYNSYLRNNIDKKILVFVHDDVLIEDLFFEEKIINSPYDVSGLAGCKKVNLTNPPAWHLMSKKEDYLGQVSHASEINKTRWTNIYGPTQSRALILDGLLLIINNPEKLIQNNVFFDEDFNFHHYDLSFCLNCNKSFIKLGVIPLNVVHYGLGDSMNSVEWIKSSQLFKQKYC